MKADEWLMEVRGLNLEGLSRFGVKWGASSKGHGEVVAFPYRKNGEVIARKVRAVGSRAEVKIPFWWEPGGVNGLLFNDEVLGDPTIRDHPVVITEGEMDCLTVMECGFVRSVSIPDGWSGEARSDNSKSVGLMRRKLDIEQSPCIIVAGDNDEVGAGFVQAVYNMFDKTPVRYVVWPEGCKDANETLQKHGQGKVVESINAAQLVKPEGGRITGFADAPPAPNGRVYTTGIEPIDRVICFHEGFPTVITGIPESGKSTFATWALHMAGRHHGLRNAVALMETPWPILRDHLSRMVAGRPFRDVVDKDALVERLDENWRLMHTDDSEGGRMDWVKSMIRSASVDHGCSIITFDPWNEIEHRRGQGESETEYTNAALAKIRQWAERYGCAVVMIAHPTKMQGDAGSTPKPPLGYDISGSSAWYNKAAVGVTVHRDENGDPVIINWKSKFRQLYPCRKGKIELRFDEQSMVYRSAM